MSNCIFLGDNCKNNSQSKIKKWILENMKEGDVVVISNRHMSNSDKNNYSNKKYNWFENISSIKSINEFNRLVLSKRGKTVLFAPTPEYDLSIRQCISNWFRPFANRQCTKTIEQVREEKSKVYFLINNYLDNTILVYNPLPDICFEGICSMSDKQSKPLYFDDDHLSDYANSEYLFPGFVSFLKKQQLLSY